MKSLARSKQEKKAHMKATREVAFLRLRLPVLLYPAVVCVAPNPPGCLSAYAERLSANHSGAMSCRQPRFIV
jgi:hypothetical protein